MGQSYRKSLTPTSSWGSKTNTPFSLENTLMETALLEPLPSSRSPHRPLPLAAGVHGVRRRVGEGSSFFKRQKFFPLVLLR
jgi:hypothetical protein